MIVLGYSSEEVAASAARELKRYTKLVTRKGTTVTCYNNKQPKLQAFIVEALENHVERNDPHLIEIRTEDT